MVESVATPAFSAAGLVDAGTKVSISCETEGASIYYTLDGTEPTATSTLYTAPIEISQSVTVKAIAVKTGMQDSRVATVSFSVPVKVDNIAALLDANASLDGSKRETSTSYYSLANPVTVIYQNGSNLYVKDSSGYLFIFGSLGNTYANGDVIPAGMCGKVQNYYNLFEFTEVVAESVKEGTAGTPVEPIEVKINKIADQPVSSYVKLQGVTVSGMQATLSNFSITDPEIDGVTLTGRNNFKIDATNGENLTVYGFVVKYNNAYQVYPIKITSASGQEVVAPPTFSVAAGEVMAGTEVAIACATDGASIYYTLDGTEPTATSTLYTAPIVIEEDVTIKAIAVNDGMENSSVVTAIYTVKIIGENEAIFDFTKPASLTPAYPADRNDESLSSDGNNNYYADVTGVTFTVGNVSVTSTKGSTTAKIYYHSTNTIQLRVYKNSTTTVASTDPDNNIVKIAFTYNDSSSAKNTKPDSGTWSGGIWTGNAQTVVFNNSGSVQINVIEVTCAKDLTAGVDNVIAEDDTNAPVEYYNLQGVRVENPTDGLYIKRQGTKVTKVVIRN